jgi:hypothetical protein
MKKLNLFLILLIISCSSIAQNKFFIETGAGIPEDYNLGLGYRYSSFGGIEVKYGSDLQFSDGQIFHLLTLNHAIYFGKLNNNAGRKLWSFNTGLTTEFFNNEHEEGYEMFLSGWFAREIAITKRILIEPGLGVFQSVYSNMKNKDGIIEGSVILLPVYPKFGISLIFDI